jgi:hypothetical protein
MDRQIVDPPFAANGQAHCQVTYNKLGHGGMDSVWRARDATGVRLFPLLTIHDPKLLYPPTPVCLCDVDVA